MACSNCSATMHGMANNQLGADLLVFWCPRCGSILERRTTTTLGVVVDHFDTVATPRWSRPVDGVPECLRTLAVLYLLASDAATIGAAVEFLRTREGDAREALGKVRKADG